MWREKLIRTINRGIFDLKELERVEAEEAARAGAPGSEMPLAHPSPSMDEPSVFIVDWSSISPMSPFSPGLLADLGIPDTIETPSDIRSGS